MYSPEGRLSILLQLPEWQTRRHIVPYLAMFFLLENESTEGHRITSDKILPLCYGAGG